MIRRIIRWIVILLVVLLLSMYVPYYVNTCDLCDKLFVGPGYRANAVVDFFSDETQILCKDCAESQHGIGIAFGKDVSEYQNPLFVDPITLFNSRFNIEQDDKTICPF